MTLQEIVTDLKYYNFKSEVGSSLESSKAFQELEKLAGIDLLSENPSPGTHEEWQVTHVDEYAINGYEYRVARVTVFHAGLQWTMNLDYALFRELKTCASNAKILDNLERYALNQQKEIVRLSRAAKNQRRVKHHSRERPSITDIAKQ